MAGRVWTEEEIARLRELWEDPENSASKIALIFGVTRNSIIGKVDRLGLPGRRGTARKQRTYVYHYRAGAKIIPIVIPARDIPYRGVTFWECGVSDCHYPVEGDGLSAVFCGNPISHGSYCAQHYAICYEPPKSRLRAAA